MLVSNCRLTRCAVLMEFLFKTQFMDDGFQSFSFYFPNFERVTSAETLLFRCL